MEKIKLYEIVSKEEVGSLPLFFKSIKFINLEGESDQTNKIVDRFYDPRSNKKYMTDKYYCSGNSQIISKIYSLDNI